MFCRLLKGTTDIWNIYRVMSNKSYPGFLLDSSMVDENLGRYSFAGWRPEAILRSKGNQIEYKENDKWTNWEGDPLKALEEVRKKHGKKMDAISECPFPFSGGLVGYISYDMKKNIEILKEQCQDDLDMYEQYWGLYDSFVVADHFEEKVWVVAYAKDKAIEMEKEIYQALRSRNQSLEIDASWQIGEVRANFTRQDYLEAIKKVKEHIRRGDIYQANLTQRFSFEFAGSSHKFYDVLRKISPGYFGAFLHFDEYDILSISPERYIKITGSDIETRPIKGTRARGRNRDEDRLLASELQKSEKDQAELLMIVDLERNDLGRICQAGSIKVKDLFNITSYATVFHLDAVVSGKLRADIGIDEILRQTFPGGSITGAPKIMAMNIIEELEPTARGVYTGSIGYINCQGDCDLSIAIRTAVMKDNYCYYQAGGGLISDSDPEAEYEETLDKARALFMAREEVLRFADYQR